MATEKILDLITAFAKSAKAEDSEILFGMSGDSLVRVFASGLLKIKSSPTDLDETFTTGVYRVPLGTTANLPTQTNGGMVLVLAFDGNAIVQVLFDWHNNRIMFRCTTNNDPSSRWRTWKVVSHTNFNSGGGKNALSLSKLHSRVKALLEVAHHSDERRAA